MSEKIEDLRRAYILLKQVYEDDFLIKEHVKLEIEELMTPEWLKHLEEE